MRKKIEELPSLKKRLINTAISMKINAIKSGKSQSELIDLIAGLRLRKEERA